MDTLKQDLNIGELLSKHRDYVLIGVIVLVSIIAARFIYGKQMEEYARIKEEIHIEQEKSAASQTPSTLVLAVRLADTAISAALTSV